jgi:hypothetical protein
MRIYKETDIPEIKQQVVGIFTANTEHVDDVLEQHLLFSQKLATRELAREEAVKVRIFVANHPEAVEFGVFYGLFPGSSDPQCHITLKGEGFEIHELLGGIDEETGETYLVSGLRQLGSMS